MPLFKKSFRLQRQLLLVTGTSAAGYWYLAPNDNHGTLNPHTFTPFTLDSHTKISPTNSVFKLRHDEHYKSIELEKIRRRAIWSVELKQPQLQIARSYTPLPPTALENSASDDLRLLIKREKGGEVSSYLHQLPERSTVEVRGPHVECEIPGDAGEVLFLAGGTGIAPALQVADILRQKPNTRMCVLWANRKSEDCEGAITSAKGAAASSTSSGWTRWFGIAKKATVQAQERQPISKSIIVDQLEKLRDSQRAGNEFNIEYFVDEEESLISTADVAKRLQEPMAVSSHRGSKILFISGPDGFVEYWAGKKTWEEGKEAQGPLGGQLARMNLKGWSVWKL